MCLPEESASSEGLAAGREERGLGGVLQSICDWDQTSSDSGSILCDHGVLRSLSKMTK